MAVKLVTFAATSVPTENSTSFDENALIPLQIPHNLTARDPPFARKGGADCKSGHLTATDSDAQHLCNASSQVTVFKDRPVDPVTDASERWQPGAQQVPWEWFPILYGQLPIPPRGLATQGLQRAKHLKQEL